MKKYLFLLLSFPFISMTSNDTPQVKNVQFKQSGNQVIVTYDLVNTEAWQTFDVELFVSENNGYTYEGPLQKVKGDVGFDVENGYNKRIVWEALKEQREITGDRIKFKVEATIKAPKPNLYIYSIGFNYNNSFHVSDLRYTTNDAIDLLNIFKKSKTILESKLYNKVVLSDPLLNLKAVDMELKLRTITEELLYKTKPQDIIIILISGHAHISDNKFRIMCNDYNSNVEDRTTMDYNMIISILQDLRCKKIVFLDTSETKTTNIKSHNNFLTLYSSKEKEKSYDNKAWENGAFTESILESLSSKGDANSNGLITIGELYKYIYKRVPVLVKKEYNKQQTPMISGEHMNDLPIFAY